MNSYVVLSIPKRIWSIGMMSVKENMLNIADRMLSTTAQHMYFLYGDEYFTRIFQNCLIVFLINRLLIINLQIYDFYAR